MLAPSRPGSSSKDVRVSWVAVLAGVSACTSLALVLLLGAVLLQPAALGVKNTAALHQWRPPHHVGVPAAIQAHMEQQGQQQLDDTIAVREAVRMLTNYQTSTLQQIPGNGTWLQLSLDLEQALANLSSQQVRLLLHLHHHDLCTAATAAGPGLAHLVLGGNRPKAVSLAGINMHVYDSADIVSGFIKSGEGWEQKEIGLVQWALTAPLPQGAPSQGTGANNGPPVMVDVGANIGWFTMNAAKAGARVFAFEGMSANTALIRTSLCANPGLAPSITLFPLGLGPSNTTCWIISHDTNTGDGFTKCGFNTAKEAEAQFGSDYHARGSMLVRQMDSMLHEDVKVMKMDVEGFEASILAGGQRFFREYNVYYMIIEANAGIIGEDGVQRMQELLINMGYKISPEGFQGPWLAEANVKAGKAKMDGNIYAVKDRFFVDHNAGRRC